MLLTLLVFLLDFIVQNSESGALTRSVGDLPSKALKTNLNVHLPTEREQGPALPPNVELCT
jgi:hypothetical protein